ncbi:ATPase [Arsenicitalea aurantiaca]|uniref:ATPase n=1 Tax=Arsenicitalea aurantiaca TaxID=1783274 RepID=A0A433XKG3_9HYPH|nr:SRPBCC family protein [Arsenicitalea aurantiaca]RUT34543.1 ATPase [Arsenicitalea aurantiaca]
MTNARIARAAPDAAANRFATLTFEREVAAPPSALWAAWTAPAARAVWAAPTPSVTVEFLEAETKVGGREISLCKVAGEPDIRCEVGWLALEPERCSVNHEVISSGGNTQSVALVTAEFSGSNERSRLRVTVQLCSLGTDMEQGYRQGFGGGLDNLAGVAERTMILRRTIAAPRTRVWAAWANPEALPQWWGPDGFTCRTSRIDLRSGGDWVFDMIGPDGTVFPNHHRYLEVIPEQRIAYGLLWGENGPKHADAWIAFEDDGDATALTLGMVFSSSEEFRSASDMGAVELGHQTLAKLDRFVTGR